MTSFLMFLMPFGVAFFNELVWRHLYAQSQTIAQVWTGVVVLCVLVYASGTLSYSSLRPATLFRRSEARQEQHPWVLWVPMSGWSIGWMIALLTLPTDGFLKLVMLPVFFGLIWCSLNGGDAGHSMLRKIMLLTLGASVACIVLLLANRPFRLTRILSDWTGELDLDGRHFQYGQVLKAWHDLQFWGPSREPLESMHLNADRLELLQFMAEFGAWPGALVGATLILGWWALWNWIRRTKPGTGFSLEMRRLGLALVPVHGVAALAYVLFAMGLTRQPFGGGLPPYSGQQAWWALSFALVWVVVGAIQTGKSPQTVPSSRRWWVSLMGYGIAVPVLAAALLSLNATHRADNEIYSGNQTSQPNSEAGR